MYFSCSLHLAWLNGLSTETPKTWPTCWISASRDCTIPNSLVQVGVNAKGKKSNRTGRPRSFERVTSSILLDFKVKSGARLPTVAAMNSSEWGMGGPSVRGRGSVKATPLDAILTEGTVSNKPRQTKVLRTRAVSIHGVPNPSVGAGLRACGMFTMLPVCSPVAFLATNSRCRLA